jgi:ABC-2 type transport system permease protein
MRLLIVELTRLRWRRAVIVLTALAILLPALIWAGLAWDTRPISEEERRQGIEMMEQDQQWQEEALTECVAHPEQHFDPQDPPAAEEVEQACRDMFGHGSDMTPEMYVGRQALTLDNAAEVGIGVMVLVLGLALLVGATFAGADWSSGSMSNQLLFEPRRARVWAAKAGAVAIGGAVLALAGLATFWALSGGLIAVRDVSTTGDGWRDIVEAAGRGTGLAAAAALGGYVLTMFLRSTVGTLGTMLALAVGGSLLIASLPIDGNQRWMLPHNVLGILQHGYDYYDYTVPACRQSMDGESGCQQVLTLAEGVRFLGVLLLVGIGLSVASFRRRDVP